MKSLYIPLLVLCITTSASRAVECGRIVLTSADLTTSAATPRWQKMGVKLIDAGFLSPQSQLIFPKVKINPEAEAQIDRLKTRAPGWVYLTFFSRLHQRLSAVYGPETANQFLEATLLRADTSYIPQTLSPLMSADEIWTSAYHAGGHIADIISGSGRPFTDKMRELGLTTFLTGSLFEIRATLDPTLPLLERLAAELENQQVNCRESARGGNLLCQFPGSSQKREVRVFPNRDSEEKLAEQDGYICINHRGENFSHLMAVSPYRYVYRTPKTLLAAAAGSPLEEWEGGLLRLSPALAKQTIDDINLVLEVMNQTSD